MKHFLRAMLSLAIAVSALAIASAQQTRPTESPDVLLKSATTRELVNGDLDAAVRQYREIATRYKTSHPAVAAQALARMASGYERMGRSDARAAYEELLRDHGSTREAAAARARLAPASAAMTQMTSLTPRRVFADEPGVIESVTADGRFAILVVENSVRTKDLFTGHTRTFTTGSGTVMTPRPVFSPDGRHLAYTRIEARRAGELPLASLQVMSTTPGATSRTLVAADPSGRRTVALGWSPDGTSILGSCTPFRART